MTAKPPMVLNWMILPEFVLRHHGSLIRLQVLAYSDELRKARDSIYRRSTSVPANLSRRHQRNPSASRCLCEGVKFRWREGLVISAHHSSADNSLCNEGSAFDICGESSCGIGQSCPRQREPL